MLFASLHLQGKAETWFQAGADSLEKLPWIEFNEAIKLRFSEELYENVIVEFNKLLQHSTIKENQGRFEEFQPL